MIVNNKQEIVLTPEQKEKMFWDDWKFGSHRWNEYHQGYFECEYCKTIFTSQMPLGTASLCKSNPYIVELLKEKI